MPRSKPVLVRRPDQVAANQCCALIRANVIAYRPVDRVCAKSALGASSVDGPQPRLCIQHARQAVVVGWEWENG